MTVSVLLLKSHLNADQNARSVIHSPMSLLKYYSLVFVSISIFSGELVTSQQTKLVFRRMDNRKIKTHYGFIRGRYCEFIGNRKLEPVVQYFGLPYGSIKNGKLRFMPSTTPQNKWKKLSDIGSRKGPVCPQKVIERSRIFNQLPRDRALHYNNIRRHVITEQHEDCLNLNIYRPHSDTNESNAFPVMVFIHGESFEVGTGNAYDGSVLASYGRVIVVTLNYRLGVLGFLSTGTNIGSGNYALLDISAALLWINQNVANFGGDPKSITLFGHGYGAALVNLLLVSPVTGDGNLFQRGILMSGSAFSSWATSYDPSSCTKELATRVNCSRFLGNSLSLINCLRNKSITDLINMAPLAPKYFTCFGPTVSPYSSILPKSVEDLHKSKNTLFSRSSLLFGVSRNDAFDYINRDEATNGITDFRKKQIIRTFIHNSFKYNRQGIYDVLDHKYKSWFKSAGDRSRRNFVLDFLSDALYTAPLIKVSNYHGFHRQYSYMYVFSHNKKHSNQRQALKGSYYGKDLAYVFGEPLVEAGQPFSKSSENNTDIMISQAVMTYWTNFAKTGNPNKPRWRGRYRNLYDRVVWTNYSSELGHYIDIASKPKIRRKYRSQYIQIWLGVIPNSFLSDKKGSPVSHLLNNSQNLSTFDDPGNLLKISGIFPLPEPTIRPQFSTAANPDLYIATDTGLTYDGTHSIAIGNLQGNISFKTTGLYIGDHSVQISITVAVGCSLLFLNILIFAGIYHQRERIHKLRQRNRDRDRERLRQQESNHVTDNKSEIKITEYENDISLDDSIGHNSKLNSQPLYNSSTTRNSSSFRGDNLNKHSGNVMSPFQERERSLLKLQLQPSKHSSSFTSNSTGNLNCNSHILNLHSPNSRDRPQSTVTFV